MRRVVIGVLVSLAFVPATAKADQIDIQLTQLRDVAAQWWAGYGLTTDMPYAAGDITNGGLNVLPGCGTNVRILREHLPGTELGEAMWPHGCDIRLSENLVRAGFGASRTDPLRFQIRSAGLSPRGRYAATELLCAVMFHEYGHILGLPHAANGIMQDKAPAPPAACVTWGTRARCGAFRGSARQQ